MKTWPYYVFLERHGVEFPYYVAAYPERSVVLARFATETEANDWVQEQLYDASKYVKKEY